MGIFTDYRNHDVVAATSEQRNFYRSRATGTGSERPVIKCILDRYYCYLPGDTVHARIQLDKERLKDLVKIHVEFRGMIHNWGTRQGANNTTTYHVDKQMLFSHEAFINPTSLEPRSGSPHMLIASSTESAWIFDVDAKLPTAVRYRDKEGAPLPPSFIRSERGNETSTSLVSYHFKITGANEKTFSRDERTWTPFVVLPYCRPWDPTLELPLSYGDAPSHWIRQYDISDYQRKLVLKKGVVEVEVVHPKLADLPMHLEVPIILRISVRAKSLSDLLSGESVELPMLPLTTLDEKQEDRTPKFHVTRHIYTKADRTRSHDLKDVQECFVRWHPEYTKCGFTQRSDEKGGEGGASEGTPLADDRAKRGLDHGWTWPAHDPEGKHYSTPNAPRFGSKGVGPKQGARFERDVKTNPYVTTATVFGRILMSSAASVPFEVYHLSTYNRLKFKWDFKSSNKVDMNLGYVVMTSGITPEERPRLSPQDIERRFYAGHYGKQKKSKMVEPHEFDELPGYKNAAGQPSAPSYDGPPQPVASASSSPPQDPQAGPSQELPGYQSATFGMEKMSVSDQKRNSLK